MAHAGMGSKDPYQRARESVDEGKIEEGLQILESYAKKDLKGSLVGKLKIYKHLGDNQKIIEVVDQLLHLMPTNTQLKLEKAIALRNLGESQKAETLLEGIDTRSLESSDLIIELGRYLLWKNDYAGAEVLFQKASTLEPDSENAMVGLSYSLVWQGRDGDAENKIDELLAKKPNSVDALILKGWLLAWHQKFEEALRFFEKADQLAPHHPEVMRGFAQIYAWDGQYERSIPYYGIILALQPQNVDIMLDLGRVYEKVGEFNKSVGILETALNLHPERQDVQEELNLARKWTSEIDNNVRDLQRKIALNRGDVQDYVVLGQAYRWLGQLSASRKIYQEALKKSPDNIQLLYGLAQILEQQNQLEEAEKNYQRILKLKPNFVDASLGIKRIERALKPNLLLQYGFIWNRIFDPSFGVASSIASEHLLTMEYGQRLSSLYTLKAGYSFNPIRDDSQITGHTNLALFHHDAYLQNELMLPANFFAVLRYDFHDYTNWGASDFGLSEQQVRHGGYAILSRPLGFNNFSFQFSRLFFQYFGTTNVRVGRIHTFTLSDDISVGPYVSCLFLFSDIQNSVDYKWIHNYVIHPRLVLPFFTPATLEYEFNLLDRPVRQTHKGTVKLVGQFWERLQLQGQYNLSYFTQTKDIGHEGQAFLNWAFSQRMSLVLTADVLFHNNDVTENYIFSLNAIL